MKLDSRSLVVDLQEIQRLTPHFVEEFLNKVGVMPRPAVHLLFHEGQREDAGWEKTAKPINSEIKNGELLIHLCEKALEGIPALALQGWLDWELGGFLLALCPEPFCYNFRELIHPFFPVRGSAENLVRDFVNRLDSGLKGYLVTKTAVNADHATAQLSFHFYRLQQDPKEAENYRLYAPHAWIRLLFLADRFKEYMPVCQLSHAGIAPNLKSIWWTFHEFLNKEDRELMEDLAEIPLRFKEEPYPVQLLELFKASKYVFGEPSLARPV